MDELEWEIEWDKCALTTHDKHGNELSLYERVCLLKDLTRKLIKAAEKSDAGKEVANYLRDLLIRTEGFDAVDRKHLKKDLAARSISGEEV